MATTPGKSADATTKKRRLYIGGLTVPVTEQQLLQRFQPFGRVADIDVPEPEDGQTPRGFAHLTLQATDANLRRCIGAYNGAKWAGMKLRVEEAKTPPFREKLEREWEAAKRAAEGAAVIEKPKRKKRRKRNTAEYGEDLSLVTDENASTRPGWARTRYDRAILGTVYLRDPVTRKVQEVDATKFKSSLTKFGIRLEMPETSVAQLAWPEVEIGDGDSGSEPEDWPPRKVPRIESKPVQPVVAVEVPTLKPVAEAPKPEPVPKAAPKLIEKALVVEKRKKAPAVEVPAPVDAITRLIKDEKRKSLSLLSALLADEEEKELTGGIVTFVDEEPSISRAAPQMSSSDDESESDENEEDLDDEVVESRIEEFLEEVLAEPLPVVVPAAPVLQKPTQSVSAEKPEKQSFAKDKPTKAPATEAAPPVDIISRQISDEKRKSLSLLSALLPDEDDREPAGNVVSFVDDDEPLPKPVKVQKVAPDVGSSSEDESEAEGEEAAKESEDEALDLEEEGSSDVEEAQEEPEDEMKSANSSSGISEDSVKEYVPSSDSPEPSLHTAPSRQPSPPPLADGEPKDYAINTDLRSLIFMGAAPPTVPQPGAPLPKLFGGWPTRTRFSLTQALGLEEPEDEDEEMNAVDAEEPEQSVDVDMDMDAEHEPSNEPERGGPKMFFLHLGHPELDFRRHLPELPPGSKLFQRQATEEEIVKQWEERRGELTLDYKRKHKAALRRRRKLGFISSDA